MQLIPIGYGNAVSASRLVAVVSPESAPIKRISRTPVTEECSLTPPTAERPSPFLLWTATMLSSPLHRLRPFPAVPRTRRKMRKRSNIFS